MLKLYVFFLSSFFLIICFTSNISSKVVSGDPEALTVMPNAYSGTPGTAAFTGPLANAQRTYQWLINENQLTSMIGNNITALAMRIPTSASSDWPAADVTFANYDIYLAPSRPPSQRSLTFDSNIVGTKVQVRSGSLIVTANSYTFGNTPNNFGPPITFTTPYLYTGGHLLVELRHQGFTGTTRTNDAIGTAISGYGTDFSACWTGNYTGTAGSQGNFCVIRLTDEPLPVELTSFTSFINRNNVILNWITEMEINNSGFDIERKLLIPQQETQWSKVGFVYGHGNSNEQNNYTYIDNGLMTGIYIYRLKQMDYNGNFEYFNLNSEIEIGAPNQFILSQNYPNPFNPVTKINYDIPFDSKVNLKVYDMRGKEVASLVNNDLQKAGYYVVQLNAVNLSSGTYFYRIVAQGGEKDFIMTKKMILVK